MDAESLNGVDLNLNIEGISVPLDSNINHPEQVSNEELPNTETSTSSVERTQELIPHEENTMSPVFQTDATGQVIVDDNLLEEAKQAAATMVFEEPQVLEEEKKGVTKVQATSPTITTITGDNFPVDVEPIGGDPFFVGAALDAGENYYKSSSQSLRFPPVQLEWKNVGL